MKKILKISFVILAFLLFFVIKDSVSANAAELTNSNGVKMTEEQYKNLQTLGFTELAIDQMTQEIFDDNKDLVLKSESEDTTYYEVKEITDENPINKFSINSDDNYISTELSKEEYFKRVEAAKNAEKNGNIQPFAASTTKQTSYRRLTTKIQNLNGIRLYQNFIWDVIPKTRSYDVLSVSIDNTFNPKAGSQFGQQLWAVINPTTHTTGGGNAVYNSSSTTWNTPGAGYGVKMNLKNDASNAKVTDLQGYMYYNIVRANSVVPYYVNAYGNYSHAKKTVSSSYSYSLSWGAPSISWQGVSTTSFDSITTHAQTKYPLK